jgi:hypothetical protein
VTDVDSGTPSTPAGTVGFSGGPGSFAPASCELSAAGSCQVSYLPSAFGGGTHALTAAYAGTEDHGASSGDAPIGVEKRPARVDVVCRSASDKGFTCTATVTDTGPGVKSVPSGTLSFTTLKGATAKTPLSCTLAAASCAVSYPQSLNGAKQMTIEYAGGPAHLADTRTVDDPAA